MPRYEKLTLAVDFDGTLVEHAYPAIGQPTGGAFWLHRAQQEHGARIILWTVRSGDQLEEAVEWCKAHGLHLFGVNENPLQIGWSTSQKVYANIYIDDNAIGCPLIFRPGRKPYVDWNKVGPVIVESARIAAQEAAKQA